MKRLAIYFALIALTTTPALAANGTETEEEGTWLSLDREIENLAATNSASQGTTSMSVGAILRASYLYSSDIRFPNGDRLSGFSIDNLRFTFDGEHAGYGLHVETEAAAGLGGAGTVGIFEAYGHTEFAEWISGWIGQFRIPLTWTGLIQPNNLLFIPYTTSGSAWGGGFALPPEAGAQVNGNYSRVRYYGAWQNGSDGGGERARLTARIDIHAVGQDYMEPRYVEGSLGAPQEVNLTVGAGFTDDAAISGGLDGTAWTADARLTWDRLYVHGEYSDFPQDVRLASNPGNPVGAGQGLFDAKPWALTASYMFIPEKYDFAVRYEVLQDQANTRTIFVGVNKYIVGNDVKVQFNWTNGMTNSVGNPTQVFGIGMTFAI